MYEDYDELCPICEGKLEESGGGDDRECENGHEVCDYCGDVTYGGEGQFLECSCKKKVIEKLIKVAKISPEKIGEYDEYELEDMVGDQERDDVKRMVSSVIMYKLDYEKEQYENASEEEREKIDEKYKNLTKEQALDIISDAQ